MKIKCMLDTKRFEIKPTGKETGGIQNRLEKLQTEINIEELSQKVGVNGQTFKPALLNGRKESDWISSQVFALDFDNDVELISNSGKKVKRDESITLDEQFVRDSCRVKKDNRTSIEEQFEIAKNNNIMPIFIYHSFSSKEEKPKFRFVFCTNEVIADFDIAKKVQLTLMNIFDKSDEACKDLSRLYYGGKGIIYNNYNNRIDHDKIITKYTIRIIEETALKHKKVVKEGFSPRESKDITLISLIPSGENPLTNQIEDSYYNIKAIRDRNAEYLRNKIGNPKIILENNQAFFDYIKGYDLGDLLEIGYSNSFRCILHEDNSPSAGIFKNEEGTYIYHCFSCGKSYNIINMIEVLGCFRSRPKAYKFIREIFNLEIMDTEWQREQKELLEENRRALINGELEKNCPMAYKNIKRNIKYLDQLFIIAKDNVYSEKFTDNEDNVIFYSSNSHICKLLNMSENSTTEVSKKNALFAYHKLLNKINDSEIPEEMLKRSQAIAINSGNRHQKHINYYSIPSYSTTLFDEIEIQGEKWVENNYSMTAISREMFYRGEGLSVANSLYPQHTQVYDKVKEQVVDRTTTNISNLRTDKLVTYIFDILKIRDYVLEKELIDELSADGDIKTSKKEAEKQVKKSINEILLSYGLKRIRCNKSIKEKYNVDAEGYPFLIVKE